MGESLQPPESRSRRAFLLRAGLLAGAPLAFAACDTWRGGDGGGQRVEPLPARPASSGQAGSGKAEASSGAFDLTPPRREPSIRVRIARRQAGDGPLTLAAPSGSGRQWLRIARPAPGGASAEGGGAVLLVLASPIRVSPDARGWAITDATGLRSFVEGREPVEIGALKGHRSEVLVGNTSYPGAVRLVALQPGTHVAVGDVDTEDAEEAPARGGQGVGDYDVVNICPLEEYLPGVLARELYATWKPATFSAQAIAARSFACVEASFWSARRHYDVVAGQASQAYVGTTGHAPSLRAVKETLGVVLTYDGRMVPGYYSSCCGGVSADARDAISDNPANDVPPLRARPPMECCSWAPLWRWTSDQPTKDAARRLVAWGASRPRWQVPPMRGIVSVTAVQLNAYGRPVRYRVVDERGASCELPAEQLRSALNHRAAGLAALRKPVRSGNFSASLGGGRLELAGRGFGHGVGLCQHGAEGLARRGAPWREILQTYYPQARLMAAYA